MEARRVVLETDDQGRLKDAPVLPPLARVEATFLVIGDLYQPGVSKRNPAALLKGLKITGDVVAPGIDPDDWQGA